MKKGQIQFDYIVAFFLFLIIIFFTALITLQPINKSSEKVNEIQSFETSNRVSELLIKTEGLPKDWENNLNNIERLGLASNPRVLNVDKVNALSLLNYSQVKDSLDIQEYQLFLSIKSENISVTVGYLPNTKETLSMIKRYAVLDGETATIMVGIW